MTPAVPHRTSRRQAVLAGLGAVAFVVTTAPSRAAHALPRLGVAHAEVRLQDSWDRTQTFTRVRGLPTLLLYEDKDSTSENAPLKTELARLARSDMYKRSVALVAIADVSGYDYWPVRGFVRDAIQDESHKQGTVIFCDWDGGVRNALGLDKHTSNVVLYGRDGTVLFAASGPLGDTRRAELLDILRTQINP